MTDVEITVNDSFVWEHDYNLYIGTATVHSDDFTKLSGVSAFGFAQRFSALEAKLSEYEDENNVKISFITGISTSWGEFSYDYESGTGLQYLMGPGNESYVTYNDGKIIYNKFDDMIFE